MQSITQSRFGGPEVLELVEVPRPTPLPTEVLVRVHATSVNPVDAFVRSGAFPVLGEPPFTLGWDVSGVVEDVVPGVSRFKVGDEVYGMPFFPRAGNTYAQYVAVPSRQLARKPNNLDHLHAAAVPLAGLTAWQSLVDIAQLTPGRRVLIHGAGGGVGHLAVQIAKALGAHVIGTASAAKHDFVRGLGADEVIDYRTVDFAEATGDIDVVLDTIGGDYAARSQSVLRPGGIHISLTGPTEPHFLLVEPDHAGLLALTDLVEKGLLTVTIDTVFPLAEAAKAHALGESGRTTGKIVLAV